MPFLELESIPLFEEYFNYSSHKKIRAHGRYGTKIWDISGQISHTVIVSFYRDVLGIHDKKEDRTIPFDGELRRYLIAGLIDM